MSLHGILGPLIDAEEWTLEALHSIGLGWGLAIVALTVLVRLAIVPLTVRQFRSQQHLAKHVPELRRLKERHSKDPERLRRETRAYYREHKISPLASILPTLLQVPIFISLYFLMREDVRNGLFEHAGFLFIPDLTARPHGAVLAVLLLGYVGSQLASSAVATRTLTGNHRRAALAMPLLFAGVAIRFPAGLLVYWITSSLWSLGQQLVLWRARTRLAVAVEPSPAKTSRPVRTHSKSKKKRRRRR